MDEDIRQMMAELLADVQARNARWGDVSYNTLFVVTLDLTSSQPYPAYCRALLRRAIDKKRQSSG